jgi:hypothetical protein
MILSFVAIILACGLLWLNYASLNEAYGSGPPYYSRSTNMDKWVNPLPVLIPVDALALAAVAILLQRRRLRH